MFVCLQLEGTPFNYNRLIYIQSKTIDSYRGEKCCFEFIFVEAENKNDGTKKRIVADCAIFHPAKQPFVRNTFIHSEPNKANILRQKHRIYISLHNRLNRG